MLMARVEWEGPEQRWAKGGNEDTCKCHTKNKDLVTINKNHRELIILVS